MPIRWDTPLARHTARELDDELSGARLRAVRLDRDARDLTLVFKDRTLIWRLHPTRGYLRLHGAVDPLESDHRFRCTLQAVDAPPDERLLRFRFSPTRAGPVSVIVELMTTQWNACVAEGDAQTIRHLLWKAKNDERRTVGRSYRPPPPTNRRGKEGDIELDEWLQTLGTVADDERARVLVRTFAWTSPLNAQALLGASREAGEEADLATGFDRWKGLAAADVDLQPVVLELEKGPQPYPLPLPGIPSHDVASLIDAFEESARAMGDGGEASPAAVLGPELLAGLERRVEQAQRRATSLEAELDGLPDPARLRSIGDLILARYHEVPGGSESATLVGFDGETIEVELEPGEPAHANASRYYDRAQKAERAAERLPALLESARAEVADLEGLLDSVRAGSADEEAVRKVVRPVPTSHRGEPQGPALPYRTFRSSGGLEIRVGRGARHNDDLTFHHSSPGDVWMHAAQAAGAHVVLRWPGPGNPPARDLREAATLAALHSKARTSGSVPVDWTLRKYVRKPRKSAPGKVLAERVETLFVEPNERLLETLAERDGAS